MNLEIEQTSMINVETARPSQYNLKYDNNRTDKKRMVLGKYFAELIRNSSQNISSEINPMANYNNSSRHNGSERFQFQGYSEGDPTQDMLYHHKEHDIYTHDHHMGWTEPFHDSTELEQRHASDPNMDYLAKLHSLKLESSCYNCEPSSIYLKDECVDYSNRDSHSNLTVSNLGKEMFQCNKTAKSNFELLGQQEQINFNSAFGGASECISVFSENQIDSLTKDDLTWDIDEPLDLSVPKEEDSPYNSILFDNYADFPHKEEPNEETNAWLKKIKTGTRSRVRSPKSWEFLLRLLMDPRSNPSMIKWEDERNGTFRLVQKDEIAKIWGMRSSKHKDGGLSYDNFARNLRYHYKTKMLVPVSEKHLVYRFSNEVMEKRYSLSN